jgi:hypothetical protein
VRWSWFQFLDVDVALGYTSRMKVRDLWVTRSMRDHFEQALTALAPRERGAMLQAVRDLSSHSPAQIEILANTLSLDASKVSADTQVRSVLGRHFEEAAAFAGVESTGVLSNRLRGILRDLVAEMRDYASLAKALGLPASRSTELFVLAYSGSVWRRGVQYLEQFTRLQELPIAYWPDMLRASEVLGRTGEGEPRDPAVRVYWFSYGNLVATAIERSPVAWTPDLILTTLAGLKGDLRGLSFSVDLTTDELRKGEANPARLWGGNLQTLRQHLEIARAHGLVTPDDLRPGSWIAALVRLWPSAALNVAQEWLKSLSDRPVVRGLIKTGDDELRARLREASMPLTQHASSAFRWLQKRSLRRELTGGRVEVDRLVGPIVKPSAWARMHGRRLTRSPRVVPTA